MAFSVYFFSLEKCCYNTRTSSQTPYFLLYNIYAYHVTVKIIQIYHGLKLRVRISWTMLKFNKITFGCKEDRATCGLNFP
jgi:hypothetical protein